MALRPTTQENWLGLQKALRESESRAVAGQFSAAIMHEINNPLETMSNLAYLIREDAEDAARVRQYMGLMESELANVIRIAKHTLSFFKPSGARLPVDLVAVAESALRVHERKIEAKRIRLTRDLASEATIEVHPGEMLQVISNLLGNALDALPNDGTLCVRIRKRDQEVNIMVVDGGHGIPEEILSKVFEPFFTTKKDEGTGLGLAISKSIVEGHHGRIKTRSSTRSGRSGTAFRISLPLKQVSSCNLST